MKNLKIVGVNIFLERRKTRLYVGALVRKDGELVFTYDEHYFRARNVIPVGPEFPLTQRQFSSEFLFPSFVDRIPSLQNPAYPEYCEMMGIDPKEKDPLVLLSTIARRGPSSFIYYPMYERKITSKEVIDFRKKIGLTTREFATVFEFSQSALNGLERDRILGSEILKRLEILLKHPHVALEFLTLNGGCLMFDRWKNAVNSLKAMQEDKGNATL